MKRHMLLLPSLLALVAAQAPQPTVESVLAEISLTPANPAEIAAQCDRRLSLAKTLQAAFDRGGVSRDAAT